MGIIHETPAPSGFIKNLLTSIQHEPYPLRRLQEKYEDFETIFVALHPFQLLKDEESRKHIDLNEGSKWKTCYYTSPVSWQKVMLQSRLENIAEVDQCIAFQEYHRRSVDIRKWKKYKAYKEEQPLMLKPLADHLAEHWIDATLQCFQAIGYTHIQACSNTEEWSDDDACKKLHPLEELLTRDFLPACNRLTTPDGNIKIVTDFDLHFSYYAGPKQAIQQFIEKVNLEGFYADHWTTEAWSYEEIPREYVFDYSRKS